MYRMTTTLGSVCLLVNLEAIYFFLLMVVVCGLCVTRCKDGNLHIRIQRCELNVRANRSENDSIDRFTVTESPSAQDSQSRHDRKLSAMCVCLSCYQLNLHFILGLQRKTMDEVNADQWEMRDGRPRIRNHSCIPHRHTRRRRCQLRRHRIHHRRLMCWVSVLLVE